MVKHPPLDHNMLATPFIGYRHTILLLATPFIGYRHIIFLFDHTI